MRQRGRPALPEERGLHRFTLWLLRECVGLGVVALLHYYGWWLEGERVASLWVALALAPVVLYGSVQLLGSWLLYLAAPRPRPLGQELM